MGFLRTGLGTPRIVVWLRRVKPPIASGGAAKQSGRHWGRAQEGAPEKRSPGPAGANRLAHGIVSRQVAAEDAPLFGDAVEVGQPVTQRGVERGPHRPAINGRPLAPRAATPDTRGRFAGCRLLSRWVSCLMAGEQRAKRQDGVCSILGAHDAALQVAR